MSEQQLPLVFALKHLHIRAPDPPADFSQSARLMQGERVIPSATDEQIELFLKAAATGSLPSAIELKVLQMSCPGWPEDAVYAFAGITAFGANGIDRAKGCARHALGLNRGCQLARQLVRLLAAKSDVRCPMGVDASRAPDVPSILAAET